MLGSIASRLSVEVGLDLLGLNLGWENLRLVTPWSSASFVVFPNARRMVSRSVGLARL